VFAEVRADIAKWCRFGEAVELEGGCDHANSEVVTILIIVLLIMIDLRYQYYNMFCIKNNNKIRMFRPGTRNQTQGSVL
jgi:hypothetical protein